MFIFLKTENLKQSRIKLLTIGDCLWNSLTMSICSVIAELHFFCVIFVKPVQDFYVSCTVFPKSIFILKTWQILKNLSSWKFLSKVFPSGQRGQFCKMRLQWPRFLPKPVPKVPRTRARPRQVPQGFWPRKRQNWVLPKT